MRYILVAIVAFIVFGCDTFPRDPAGTYGRIQAQRTLRVGYARASPWVVVDGSDDEPVGIEPGLIKEFADSLRCVVIWQPGNTEQLFRQLEAGELDLVVAGIIDDTPWRDRKLGMTLPFAVRDGRSHVMMIRQGENQFLIALENYLLRHTKNNDTH